MKILSVLDHPNITKYYETYESPQYIFIVMEYCAGGDLFDKLIGSQKEKFTERSVAEIMKKLFLAINHCHSNSVCHRDLKPENIMFGDAE